MTRIRPSRLIALCLSLLATAPVWAGAASTDGVFRFEKEEKLPARPGTRYLFPKAYSTAMVDLAALKTILAAAPREGTSAARSNPLVLELPMPDGSFQRFAAMESSIMEAPLQERFPEIRTYSARGIDDPAASVRFDVTPWGFHAQILGPGGRVWIDPYRHGDTQNLLVYYTKDYTRTAARQVCLVKDEAPARPGLAQVTRPSQAPVSPNVAVGTTLRTFRTAVGVTGEYTAFYGGTVPGALAGIVTSINRITGVYEIDMSIRLILVASETNVIFTNPATDPYANTVTGAQLTVNNNTLNAAPPTGIGSANYDIGHMFTTENGGGLAQYNVVCDPSKGRGGTGLASPLGDTWDIDFVAHEIGHQFGGSHSFNGTTGNCGSNNRSAGTAFEVGSGTTIMGYAGICGGEDVQPHSDAIFHGGSYDEILGNTIPKSCYGSVATGNNPPAPNAGASFTIPVGTPFALTGSATDPDAGDAAGFTYLWEEMDLGDAAPPNNDISGARPIFRDFVPVTTPTRTFPALTHILNNNNIPPASPPSEVLPAITRAMTFRFTVRDNKPNGGGVNFANTTVNVNAGSGPFSVTSQNTATNWTSGSQTITWNVANTTAAPVSCANVAITFSADGGNTFPTTLLASTPNDGTENVTAPAVPTATGRVKVSCVGNIFFDINNAAINNTGVAAGPATQLSVTGHPSPSTQCVQQTITVTARDINGNIATSYLGTVHFTSTDGAATLPANYTFTVGDAGVKTFNVTLRTTGSRTITATDTVTASITGTHSAITVNAVGTPTAGSNSPICSSQTLNLTATTIPGATYSWTGPNGFLSTQQNPSLAGATAAAAGNYVVKAIIGTCESATSQVTVVVNNTPAAPSITGATAICTNAPLSLSASAGYTGYQWFLGGNPIGGATGQTYTVASAQAGNAGNYTVTGTIAGGCTSPQSGNTAVTVAPCAALTVSTISKPCASTTGGLALTINGTNFQPGATVTLVNVPATVTNVTPTQISITTGARVPTTPAQGNVRVTNPDTQFAQILDGFSYGLRGDANGNGTVTGADAFALNLAVFLGGTQPPTLCNGDANSSGATTGADAFFMNLFIFLGGTAPGP